MRTIDRKPATQASPGDPTRLDENTILSSHRVADLLQASPSAVISWFDQGKLEGFRTPGGHRRVRVGELRRFLETHNMPVPTSLRGVRALPRSVFIIDDQPKFISAMKRTFAMSHPSVQVDGCTNGIEALVSLGANPPDLILLDIYLGDLDGFEVCRRLRQIPRLATAKIIAISGLPSEEDRDRILQAGAQAYLPKPIRVANILSVLGSKASEL